MTKPKPRKLTCKNCHQKITWFEINPSIFGHPEYRAGKCGCFERRWMEKFYKGRLSSVEFIDHPKEVLEKSFELPVYMQREESK